MNPKRFFYWALSITGSLFVMTVLMPLAGVFVIGLVFSHFGEAPTEGENRVAVIEVEGMILDSREIVEQLYAQADEESVKGIVLRINSPGGAVGPAQEIYHAVKNIREKKPVVASMGAVAASGGLYVALGASRVLCQPGTLTGSIGVIMQLPNVGKLTERLGVDMITIKSGELKDAGNSFRSMTSTEKEYLQSTVNAAYEQFLEAVAQSRGLAIDDVKKFSDGRVILGGQAVQLGLVDGIGDLREAAKAVFEILGQPLADGEVPELFYPMEEGFTLFKDIMRSVDGISDKFFASTSARMDYRLGW